RAPFRDPKAAEEQECDQGGRTREQADDQQYPQGQFRRRLPGSYHCRMARHKPQNQLPCRWRMAVLNVEVDHACVTGWGGGALPQILEEDRYKHRTDDHANQCQTVWRIGLTGEADCRILCWSCVCR